MTDKTLRSLKLFGVGLLFLAVIVFISQVLILQQRINLVHPWLGWLFVMTVLAVAGYTVGYPIFMYMKLPRAMGLPPEEDEEARKRYRQQLIQHLNRNKILEEKGLLPIPAEADDTFLMEKLGELNKEAESLTKRTASQVFLTTAVSQNGSLDGLFVLVSATKMVWQIAVIYHQRPNPKDFIKLYINVAATVLLAREIEDLDVLDEQMEPMITTLFGSMLGSFVPGVNAAVNILVNSAIQGTANAFLTLRVGFIAQQYMGSLVQMERRRIKRSASLQAARLLGAIVSENAGYIRKAAMNLSKKGAGSVYHHGKNMFTGIFRGPGDHSNTGSEDTE